VGEDSALTIARPEKKEKKKTQLINRPDEKSRNRRANVHEPGRGRARSPGETLTIRKQLLDVKGKRKGGSHKKKSTVNTGLSARLGGGCRIEGGGTGSRHQKGTKIYNSTELRGQ